jgi:mitogen-activated protein kinase kinase kinase 11
MQERGTKRQYAVKDFPPAPGTGADISISFLREVDALIKLSHPCVLQIRGIALPTPQSGGKIATDYMERGSLEDVLTQVRGGGKVQFWTHDRIAVVIAGIALGMRHIHRMGFIHRDLKPANLLLDAALTVRIADMGTCKLTVGNITQTMMVGTPLYSAPDVYRSDTYDSTVDVYSFALLWYELMTNERAFAASLSLDQIARSAMGGIRPQVPGVMPPSLQELMNACWAAAPEERKSFDVIVQMFKRCGWRFWNDVDTQVVAEYVEKIELWERERAGSGEEEQPPDEQDSPEEEETRATSE